MTSHDQPLDTLKDIKRIMERSSRFISLSGLSGVSAGLFALVATYFAHNWITDYYQRYNDRGYYLHEDFARLKSNLFAMGMVVMAAAVALATYFTWRKAAHDRRPVWDSTSRRMLLNLFIPIASGGAFIIGMLFHNVWQFVAPACLVFYGLGLVNASKYTYTDVRYVGLLEIVLGIINLFYISYGLYFWAIGFGVLHIIYGIIMWWKYEKQVQSL